MKYILSLTVIPLIHSKVEEVYSELGWRLVAEAERPPEVDKAGVEVSAPEVSRGRASIRSE